MRESPQSSSAFPKGAPYAAANHMSLEVRKHRFGWFLANHHGDGRLAISCKVPALVAAQMRSLVPMQFHAPKYAAGKGWIGLWLDVAAVDWDQVEVCLVEAYRTVAPKTLAANLRTD